jgi:hypothetical protein
MESDGASHGESLLESYHAYQASGKGQTETYADLQEQGWDVSGPAPGTQDDGPVIVSADACL